MNTFSALTLTNKDTMRLHTADPTQELIALDRSNKIVRYLVSITFKGPSKIHLGNFDQITADWIACID